MLREFRKNYKRAVAFLLTVAMTFTNIGANLSIAFAADEKNNALFLLDGSELMGAVQEAREGGELFDYESLEVTSKNVNLKHSYEKLLGEKDAQVYQLVISVEESYAPSGAEMQAFYRADTDEVIFLFLNDSDESIVFRANVGGYETTRVTVSPNSANIEAKAPVNNGGSGSAGAADENEITDATDETDESEITDATDAADENEITDATDAADESEITDATDAADKSEITDATDAADESEITDATDAADESEITDATDETDESEITDATDAADESEITDAADEDNAADENSAADENDNADVDAADDGAAAVSMSIREVTTVAAANPEIEAETSSDASKDDELEDSLFDEDGSIKVKGKLGGKSLNQVTVWETTEARAYRVAVEDLIGKAVEGYTVSYTTNPVASATIIGPEVVAEGQNLYFTVEPQAGFELTGVTANGEELEAMDAAEIASFSNAGEEVPVYTVWAVEEDLEIEASLTEVAPHPSFEDSVALDGVTISASAKEGILPEGTELSVVEVTEQVESAVKEKVESEAAGETTVTSVIAYDINLMLDGKKLNNTWGSGRDSYVTVKFSGERIEEASKEADTVEVATLETPTETVEAALGGTEEAAAVAEITAANIEVNTEGREAIDVSDGESIDEVVIDAKHFTIYTIVYSKNPTGIKAVTVDTDGTVLDASKTENLSLTTFFKSVSNLITAPDGYELQKVVLAGKYTDQKTVEINDGREVKRLKYKNSGSDRGVYYSDQQSGYGNGTRINNDQSIYFVYAPAGQKGITFDLNGGGGTTPETIYAAPGTLVTLPEKGNINRAGYELLGWSTGKDSSAVVGEQAEYAGYRELGDSTYEMPSKDVTLYAAWAQNEGPVSGLLTVAIRTDGKKPDEPAIIYDMKYVYPIQNQRVTDLTTYFSPIHTVTGVENVEHVLNEQFYIELNKLNKDKEYWNPEEETVAWYVIKDQRNNAEPCWHIDGVKRSKELVSLDYDRNGAPSGNEFGNAPMGVQYEKASVVTVDDEKENTLKWPGFTFTGWNTKADGTGTTYQQGDKFTLNTNTTLYAQWQLKGTVSILYTATKGGSVDPASEPLNPDTGIAVGSTATANVGYQFDKWIDENEEQVCETAEFTPERPTAGWVNGTKFTAVFSELDDFAVNYNTGGGSAVAPKAVTWTQGDLTNGVTTEKKGYVLAGWYKDEAMTTSYTNETYADLVGNDVEVKSTTLYAKWEAQGTFRVWEYFPNQDNPDLSTPGSTKDGRYIAELEDYGVNGESLTYTDPSTGSTELNISAVQTIMDYSKARMQSQSSYEGAKVKRVYLTHELDKPEWVDAPTMPDGGYYKYWSKEIEATFDKDDNIETFPGLGQEVFHTYNGEKKESRLHITYELPKQVQVEYWKEADGEFVKVENEGYSIDDPEYIYPRDNVSIKVEGGVKEKDILKIVPESLPGYKVDKVVYVADEGAPTGKETALKTNYSVKGQPNVQRVCVLLKADAFEITYDLDGGELAEDKTNPETYTVETETFTLNNPTKSGYTFIGWSGTGLPGDRNTKVTVDKGSMGDRNYTAYWSAIPYTITYELHGGSVDELTPNPSSYTIESDDFTLNNPTKPGYTFTGWSGTELAEETETVTVKQGSTGNRDYEAHWTANTDTGYKVEYYYTENGVYPAEATRTDNKRTGTTATTVTVTEADKTAGAGYAYDTSAANVESGTVAGDGSLTLKLYFKEQFTVKYLPGSQGTFAATETKELDYNSVTPTAPEVSGNVGYTFAGWDPTPTANVTANVEYTAQWTANSGIGYKVEYYYAENGVYPAEATRTDNKRTGTTATTVTVTEADKTAGAGYAYDTSAANVESGTVAGDGSLTLKLYFKEQFTVKYLPGSQGTFAATETKELDYNSVTPTAPEVSGNVGYTFAGWDPTPTASVTANVEYTAQWTANSGIGYKVEYYLENPAGNVYDLQEDDTETLTGTTGALAAYTVKTYTGFKYNPSLTTPSDKTILGDGNLVIELYYDKDTSQMQEVTYRVEYFKDNVKVETDGYTERGAVWVGDPAEIALEAIDTSDTRYAGYTLDYTDPSPIPAVGTMVDSGRIFKVYYALDEIGTVDPEKPDGIPDKYQVTFTYVAGTNGKVEGTVKEVVTREKDGDSFSEINPAYPKAAVTEAPDAGYDFNNWTSDVPGIKGRLLREGQAVDTFANTAEIKAAGFAQNAEFTAHFLADNATTYAVERYYEAEGKYPSSTPNRTQRAGATNTTAEVTEGDLTAPEGYVLDDNAAGKIYSGVVAGNNSLVLKVYFKQVFNVTYKPGAHGSFKEQKFTGYYGVDMPQFSGDKTANGSYRFTGWDKTVGGKLTEDTVYTAQWIYTGGGGSSNNGDDDDNGGGTDKPSGGGTDKPGGGTPEVGPGADPTDPTPIIIDSNETPLAALPPNGGGTDEVITIVEDEVPLGALPKTGRTGASGLMFLVFSIMLTAYAAATKKKEED